MLKLEKKMMKEDAKAEILVPKQPVVGLLLSSAKRRRRKDAAGDEEDAPSRSSTCLSLSHDIFSPLPPTILTLSMLFPVLICFSCSREENTSSFSAS